MPVLPTQPSGPTRFTVEYQVVMPATTAPGPAYQYRRPAVITDLVAASAHPKDLLDVLNANVSLMSGEKIEILQVRARDWNSATCLN